MELIRKKIKFKNTIDFNFVSNALDTDSHLSLFSGLWQNDNIMQSVIQIRNVDKNEKFKYVYDQLKKHCNKKQKKYELDILCLG